MSRCSRPDGTKLPAPKLPTRYLPCRYAHSTLDHGGAETLQNTCQPRHPAPGVPITTTNTNPPFLRPGVRGLTTVYDCVLTSASNIASQDSPGPACWPYTHSYTGPRANLSSSSSSRWIGYCLELGLDKEEHEGPMIYACYVARGRAPTGRYACTFCPRVLLKQVSGTYCTQAISRSRLQDIEPGVRRRVPLTIANA